MSIKLRHQTFWMQQWVPDDLRQHYGNRRHIEVSLKTSDRREAERKERVLSGLYLSEFAKLRNGADPTAPATLREIFQAALNEGTSGAMQALGFTEGPAHALEAVPPAVAGIDIEIDKLADSGPDLTPAQEARLAGLQDARRTLKGSPPKSRPEYEAPFSEVAADYMRQWKASADRKPSNTEQQKLATFDLFQRYWQDKPMRGIGDADAATFHDALRLLDPVWARTKTGRGLEWKALLAEYGNRPKGLSQATINRHMAALKSLWTWAAKRGHCSGSNPFDSFHRKIGPCMDTAPSWPRNAHPLPLRYLHAPKAPSGPLRVSLRPGRAHGWGLLSPSRPQFRRPLHLNKLVGKAARLKP